MLLAGLAASCAPRAPLPAATSRPRVAALDWALAETLMAVGCDPIALVAASDWNRFVVEPRLPPGVADLGVQQQLNFELLAALRPDLVLTSPFSQALEPAIGRIAPVERFSIFEPTAEPLAHPRLLTQQVGARVGRANAAAAFIAQTDEAFDALRRRVASLAPTRLLLVNFLDARHVRVYGGAGLYQNVLNQLGIENAWTGQTNAWGFATIGVERLATSDEVRLIAFEPVPGDARPTLAQSPLWRELPFVRAGRIDILPPVLMFGALPAALRFARMVVETLERHA